VVRVSAHDTKESDMNATSLAVCVQSTAGVIVGVDLAKTVFALCVADARWRPVESHRLSRAQFERWFANRAVSRVVMEACGSAHHWARWLGGLGIEVTLLPARYVRAYVRRNKTDAADAAALLEAARCCDLRPVRVKSVEQQALQALQALHRTRSLWQADRTRRINTLRGYCREFGIAIVPGIGLLTSTALVAATSGEVSHFKDARHFASWFGLTPREHSSGQHRQLGRISKQGDRYLRMLLTHGARSVLRAAAAARNAGKQVTGLRAWALGVQDRSNHNKACCALANKLARVAYACLRDHSPYDAEKPNSQRTRKKTERLSFEMPAGALAA
jgi:transposase